MPTWYLLLIGALAVWGLVASRDCAQCYALSFLASLTIMGSYFVPDTLPTWYVYMAGCQGGIIAAALWFSAPASKALIRLSLAGIALHFSALAAYHADWYWLASDGHRLLSTSIELGQLAACIMYANTTGDRICRLCEWVARTCARYLSGRDDNNDEQRRAAAH